MVYISSSALSSAMRTSVMNSQNELATAQQELSSGTYADLGLTLGSSSGQLLEITQQQSRLGAYTATNALASTRLTGTASALTALQTSASSFLSTLTSAGSAGSSLAGLQVTGSSNLQALIAGLNTTIAGQAIFGGINTDATPIGAYADGSASKTAVDSAFSAAFGTSQTGAGASTITASQMTSFLNGSFASLFSASSFSGTWSTASDTTQTSEIAPGQTTSTSVSANESALRGLAQAYTMVTEFTGSGSTLSAAAQQAVVAQASAVLGTAVSALTGLQANVGVSQGAVSSASDQITAQTNLLSTQQSDMQDTDIYALNTRITSLQTQIEASYQLTSSLQKLSLVNYYTA